MHQHALKCALQATTIPWNAGKCTDTRKDTPKRKKMQPEGIHLQCTEMHQMH